MIDEVNPFKDGEPCLAWIKGQAVPVVVQWRLYDEMIDGEVGFWHYCEPLLAEVGGCAHPYAFEKLPDPPEDLMDGSDEPA